MNLGLVDHSFGIWGFKPRNARFLTNQNGDVGSLIGLFMVEKNIMGLQTSFLFLSDMSLVDNSPGDFSQQTRVFSTCSEVLSQPEWGCSFNGSTPAILWGY